MAAIVRFMFLAPRLASCRRFMVPFSALLYACGDRDVTHAAPVPAPVTAPVEADATPPRGLVVGALQPDALRWPRPAPEADEGVDAGSGAAPASQSGAASGAGLQPEPDAGVPAEEEPPPPLDCSAVTPAPASYELLEGFTGSEDFVFDEQGNYVGIDDDNNLVRISRDRERTLWVPKIGSVAGMGVLPDGSVVFCEVNEGAIKRVYPNGSVVVVLGGLLYPNGLDIGPDGFVYVAENNAGRVRRIDPDTGDYTIVAMGLHGPNGVAFSDDPGLLYVGSFEGSGVYKVEVPAPGELGEATVFARPPGSRLREPELACPDQVEGVECFATYHTAARCQAMSNVIDCLPVDPCPDLEEGAYCDYPRTGVCRESVCEALTTCEELGEGAACEIPYSGPGVCQSADGYLYCGPPNPCEGLSGGDACEDYFGTGTCQSSDGYTYCAPPDPCAGLSDGDSCSDPFSGPGVCRAFDSEYTYCEPQNPCEGLSAGEACEDFFFGAGVCQTSGDYSYCAPPDPCAGLGAGEACEDPFSGPGICQPASGFVYCLPPGPCDELAEGATCQDPFAGTGVCQAVDGYVYCVPPDPCGGLSAGDACEDPYTGAGVCRDQEGVLLCTPPNACEGLLEGELCQDPYLGEGTCQGGVCFVYEPSGGGIDGLGVDACGNVYATEYIYGKVWRISPAGELELLAELPSAWIPNIKWGRGLGGFSSDVMYVADRDRQRLFGLYVGVPGVTEFFAAGN